MSSEILARETAGGGEGAGGTVSGDVMIRASGLGKCYHLYDKPRDRMKQAVVRVMGKRLYREFWALRGVSFEVKRGEAVGVIGLNGSGKSTLLQIIAGTLSPTEGEAMVRGRVAALLELGSGFDPEFTGRDNVYLNGAILGISKEEMDERFGEIASFADIGQFMDQPVKTYSSGMRARLAFAVSSSVSPDILIVDEVLAVGDMHFQQRCLARLRNLMDSGVTVLFVSHSPGMVKGLCQKGLLLVKGAQDYWGTAEHAVDRYVSQIRHARNTFQVAAQGAGLAAASMQPSESAGSLRYGSGQARIEKVELRDAEGKGCRLFKFGQEVVLEMSVRVAEDVPNLCVGFVVRDSDGVDLFGTTSFDEGARFTKIRKGDVSVARFRFRSELREGNYGVCVWASTVGARMSPEQMPFDHIDACVAFGCLGEATRPVWFKMHHEVKAEVVTEEVGKGAGGAGTPPEVRGATGIGVRGGEH